MKLDFKLKSPCPIDVQPGVHQTLKLHVQHLACRNRGEEGKQARREYYYRGGLERVDDAADGEGDDELEYEKKK